MNVKNNRDVTRYISGIRDVKVTLRQKYTFKPCQNFLEVVDFSLCGIKIESASSKLIRSVTYCAVIKFPDITENMVVRTRAMWERDGYVGLRFIELTKWSKINLKNIIRSGVYQKVEYD